MSNVYKALEDLKEVHELQVKDGNWNVSHYMTGLYNGLELAMSNLEDREPDFRNCPEPEDDEDACIGCEITANCPECGKEITITITPNDETTEDTEE
jgi:hypothetical protein